MKLKKSIRKPYGLRARFTIILLCSGLFCSLVFYILFTISEHVMTDYFAKSDFERKQVERQSDNLQAYIEKHRIASTNLTKLKKWEKRQPLIMLEIYSEGECIYSAFHSVARTRIGQYDEELIKSKNNAVTLHLVDKDVTAVLYSDFTYQFYLLGTTLAFVVSLLIFVFLFLWSNRKMIGYVCRINDELEILEGGNLDYEVTVLGNDEITDLARSLNRMKESFKEQLKTEQALHEANRRLITEMSHDLRTPLTGMMLYLEILRSHRYGTEEQLQDYLEKINTKAVHMKKLSDHLIEYSLGKSPDEHSEKMGIESALAGSVNGLMKELTARGFRVSVDLEWKPCQIQVKAAYLRRIYENIISNITKYAEPDAEVLIGTTYSDKYAGLIFTNSCVPEIEPGTGIGLESIRNMMSQMDGRVFVEETDRIFELTLWFAKK